MSLTTNNSSLEQCYFYKINRNISDDLFCKLAFNPRCTFSKEELCHRTGVNSKEIQRLEDLGMISFSRIKWKDIPDVNTYYNKKSKTLSIVI